MTSTCAYPFLDESLFPTIGGAVSGRWCEQLGNISCCLPCPIGRWRWKNVTWLIDNLQLAVWASIAVLIVLVWLLVTYAIFPASMTDRHYLSTSPLIGFMFITIAFIVPSKGQPRECYNEITPNDMQNDIKCALIGISLFFGVWVVILGCFFRSLSLHLSVCWQIKLNEKFKYISLGTIFMGSAALLAITLSVTGVQYTFGSICYLTPRYDRPTFWVPLLVFSIASLILQFSTIAYCIAVIVRPYLNHWKSRRHGYIRSVNDDSIFGAQQTASRVRNILRVQWRAILITVLVLTYVVFMAAVLMQLREFHEYPADARRLWVKCLALSNGDKMQCLPIAAPLGPSEPQLWAVLSMLILSGLLAVAILFRSRMWRAWIGLLKGEKQALTPRIRRLINQQSSARGGPDIEITPHSSSH